ncbi:MAG: hypothetical protein PUJ82_06130 [Spirochaetales bacterium]|nr:hypothetical protein [Spirochaetales bacterium]
MVVFLPSISFNFLEFHSRTRKQNNQKQAIRPSLTLIRFPRFAQSSGLLRRGYYPCHDLNLEIYLVDL